MRSISREHDFKVVGGYDPEKDGPEREFGRVAVQCLRCQERRRIGAPVEHVNRMGGCLRVNGTKRSKWQRGDMLKVAGEYGQVLETYEGKAENGQIISQSLGNTDYSRHWPDEVEPYTIGGI